MGVIRTTVRCGSAALSASRKLNFQQTSIQQAGPHRCEICAVSTSEPSVAAQVSGWDAQHTRRADAFSLAAHGFDAGVDGKRAPRFGETVPGTCADSTATRRGRAQEIDRRSQRVAVLATAARARPWAQGALIRTAPCSAEFSTPRRSGDALCQNCWRGN
jgi:hypothetical protein